MSNAFSALDRLKNRTNSSSEDVKSSNRKLPRSTSANSVFASIPMPRASSSEKSQESNKPLESRVKPSKLSSVLRAQSKFSGQTSVVSSKSTKSLTRSAISKLPLTNRTLPGRSNRLQRTLPWATTSLIDVRSKVKLKEHHIEDKTKYKPKYASAEQLSIVSKKEDPKEYSYLQSIDSNYTEVDLSDEQKHVLDLILNKRKNVFFTGSAGTGKSLLLRVIIGKLKTRYGISNIGICAPTGLAAANIGGKTIQRLFSIGLGKDPADVLLNRIKKNMEKYMVWRRMVVLIVDEVSMLEADLLDKLNYLAKKIKRNDQPFGGIQVIMSGDFLQLPPVTRDPTYVNYCFKSKSWNEIITEKIVLSQVFRQQGDTELVDILNALRIGRVDYHIESKLRKLSRPLTYDDGIQATELFPTRNEVERANLQQLEQLQGPELTFPCKDISTYGAPIDERVMRNFDNLMCSQTLKLKPGAQVMLIKNGLHEDLVNGELGIVEGFVTKPIYQNFIARFGSESIEARSKLLRKISMILLNKKHITNEPENDDLSLVDPLTAEVITQIIRSFDPSDNLFPVVTFQKMNGSKLNFFVEPTDFFYEATPGKDAEFIRQQLPIILSWAMSIHKSQGQTLQRVKVDLRKVFEKGQLYVAISRCVSSNGLQVLNFDRRKVFVDEEVISFYRSLSQ